MIARAFGLMCDHVEGFEIVLADGTHNKIWRPNSFHVPDDTAKDNDDLYWAVLGGSPGNFGILTHLQIRPLHDDTYGGSHAMKVATPYTKEKLEKCLQIMAEMSDDQDFPRNFDYCITLMTDIANSFYFKRSFEGKRNLTLDQEMLLYHPEQYADGVDWADKGKLAIPVRMVPMILIYFQWANVDGLTQLFGKEESKWFEKIREAMEPMVLDAPKNQVNGSPKMEDAILFARACLPDSHPGFDPNAKVIYENAVGILCYTEPTTMSQLNRYWVYEDVREYTLPYEKRVYHTDRLDLSKNGWAKWLSEQVDVIAGGYKYNDSLSLIIQIQMIGGKNSEI